MRWLYFFLSLNLCIPLEDLKSEIHSQMCSGIVKVCTQQSSPCSPRDFFLYSFQDADAGDGKFSYRSHQFDFSGAFINENPKLIRATTKHFIYEGNKWQFRMPYQSGTALYVRQKGIKGAKWQKLCH